MNLFLKLHLCGVSLFSGTAVGDESQYVEKKCANRKVNGLICSHLTLVNHKESS